MAFGFSKEIEIPKIGMLRIGEIAVGVIAVVTLDPMIFMNRVSHFNILPSSLTSLRSVQAISASP